MVLMLKREKRALDLKMSWTSTSSGRSIGMTDVFVKTNEPALVVYCASSLMEISE